jgi:hypothetical protein
VAAVAVDAAVADVTVRATNPMPIGAEMSEEAPPVAARDDGERDDGRGRGGRRRRRGGRDRDRGADRGERNRIPDIAFDGGEMLDAIASAPVPRCGGCRARA